MQTKSHLIAAFDADAKAPQLTFIGFFRPYKWPLALGLSYLLLTNLVSAVLPRLANYGVNQVVTPDSSGYSVASIVAAIALLAVVGAVIRTLSRREIFNIGRMIERDARHALFTHLMLLSRRFYRKKSVGDLMNHSLGDMTNLRMVAGFALLNFFNIIFVTAINIPILVGINLKIALSAMSPFLLAILVARLSTSRMFQRMRENQEAQSRLSAHVQENLSGAQVVRLFGQEAYESQKFEKTNDDAFKAAMRLAAVRTIAFPVTRAMAGLGIAIVLFIGGHALVNHEISLGDFVEVNTRLLMLAWPAVSVGFIISIFSQGKASLVRVNALLAEDPGLQDGANRSTLSGQIEVAGLSVRHEGKQLLGPLSHRFNEGSVTGIVGPSGSGKSLLIASLLRQEEDMQGEVYYDGVNVRDYALNTLFSQVASVLPEPFLFGESLRANICFANQKASAEEIERVLQIAALHEDVARLSEGLDTVIGEKGVMLSGGQRQRVALARALLAGPKVLLLDDCFSAVDAETEAHIVQSLKSHPFAKTVVLVSHRLGAMRNVDHILVLREGKIVEQGTHEALLERGELYQALWGVEALKEALVEQR